MKNIRLFFVCLLKSGVRPMNFGVIENEKSLGFVEKRLDLFQKTLDFFSTTPNLFSIKQVVGLSIRSICSTAFVKIFRIFSLLQKTQRSAPISRRFSMHISICLRGRVDLSRQVRIVLEEILKRNCWRAQYAKVYLVDF